MKIPHIVLLDLDGVLVQPGGYRAAFHRTVHHFLDQVGLTCLKPGEEVPFLFEAVGITNEWDMIPICLAIALEAASPILPDDVLLINWFQAADHFGASEKTGIEVNYSSKIYQLARFLRVGQAATEALIDACDGAGDNSPFPWFKEQPLMKSLFSHVSDVDNSITTRAFQNHVLGEELYFSTYGKEADIKTESLLQAFDRPQLNTELLNRLKELEQRGDLYPCVYTARPSLPPVEVTADNIGYSPEAEAAVSLVGMDWAPLMASGRIRFFADQHSLEADELIKPAPFQALAAIAAAWSKTEAGALEWAGEFYHSVYESTLEHFSRSECDKAMSLPENLIVHIFEDSRVGIQAGIAAIDLLSKRGINVQLHTWGIAQTPEKATPLIEIGAEVFEDVNHALTTALIEFDI